MNFSSQGARRLCLAVVVAVAAHPAVARAQTATDQPTAEALFAEGRRLLAEGKYADACPKFAESQRLDPAIGTLLNLGDCHEKIGQTASAWARFREAAEIAHRAGDAAREKVSKRRAAALEERLSKLTITVPMASNAPGLEVQRDGVTMGRAVWGTAAPVDPGSHRIEATAPGRKPWSTTVTVDAAHRSITVAIPALAAAPAEAHAPSQAAPAALSPSAKETSALRGHGQRVAAVVIASTGVAAVGVGSVFGVLASSKKDESEIYCHKNLCSQRGVDLRDQALTSATVSTVAFVAGAAALAGGAALWFTAPSNKEATRAGFHAAPYAGPGSIGATFGGAF
jgi:hypothetical protein